MPELHDDDCDDINEFVELVQDAPYWCAFCGEENEVRVDYSSARRQRFTEDCAVCCRPNAIELTLENDGSVSVEAEQEYS